MLWAVNPRKAAGPDTIPGCVRRGCAHQLAGVLTRMINWSLSQSIVPTCLKSSTIVHLPKKPHVSCLNDCRSVALTLMEMKCLEKLVREHTTSLLSQSFDPYQLTYKANRSIEDVMATPSMLHSPIWSNRIVMFGFSLWTISLHLTPSSLTNWRSN